jgi:hypothetical protein
MSLANFRPLSVEIRTHYETAKYSKYRQLGHRPLASENGFKRKIAQTDAAFLDDLPHMLERVTSEDKLVVSFDSHEQRLEFANYTHLAKAASAVATSDSSQMQNQSGATNKLSNSCGYVLIGNLKGRVSSERFSGSVAMPWMWESSWS